MTDEFSPEHPGIEGLDGFLSSLEKKLEEGNAMEAAAERALHKRQVSQVNRAFGRALVETNGELENHSVPYTIAGLLYSIHEWSHHAQVLYHAGYHSSQIRKFLIKQIEDALRQHYISLKTKARAGPILTSLRDAGVSGEEILRRLEQGGVPSLIAYGCDIAEKVIDEKLHGAYLEKEKLREVREFGAELSKRRTQYQRFIKEMGTYADEHELTIDIVLSKSEHLIPVIRGAYGTLEDYYLVKEGAIEAAQKMSEAIGSLQELNVRGKLSMIIAKKFGLFLDLLKVNGKDLEKVIDIPAGYVHDLGVFGKAFFKALSDIESQELDHLKKSGGFL